VEEGSYLLLIVLFLIFSAFFSGSETAFFSLNKIQLKKLEKSKSSSSKRVLKLLQNPHRLLITILLGNTLVNVSASAMGAMLAVKIFGDEISHAFLLFFEVVIMTGIILTFGEILPKLFAYSSNEKFAEFAGLFLEILEIILWPFVRVLELISGIFSKAEVQTNFLNSKLTTEDFKSFIISESEKYKLDENEEKIIKGILNMPSTEVREIMVPRVDMIAADVDSSIDELKKMFSDSGYSRIPVYNEKIDDIVGIVYAKDIILNPEKSNLKAIMRRPYFIPENTKIHDLLNHFRGQKIHLAIIVNEYGVTSGLVTLEDILEELVGEIEDEYDNEEPMIKKLDEEKYRLSGMCSIYDLNQDFELEIDEEVYDNLAEFLLDQFDKLPEENCSLKYLEKAIFTVTDIEGQRIKYVTLELNR